MQAGHHLQTNKTNKTSFSKQHYVHIVQISPYPCNPMVIVNEDTIIYSKLRLTKAFE